MRIDVDVLNNLMPNLLTFVTQLAATLIMFLLLKKFVWKPVKNIMARRSAYEQDKLAQADALKKENEALKAQMEQQLQQASEQAQRTIAAAEAEGNSLKQSLVKEGEERSRQIVEDAQHSAAMEKAKMLDDMHEQIVDVAMSAAQKMIGGRLDEQTDRRQIDEFVKEVGKK